MAIFLQEAEKLDASARVLEMITDGALTATSNKVKKIACMTPDEYLTLQQDGR